MTNGFFRSVACSPQVHIADVDANVSEILAMLGEVATLSPDLVVFPEMSLTGYTCADLFHNSTLLTAAERGLRRIVDEMPPEVPLCFVGMPVKAGDALYNCAVAVCRGRVLGIVPKTYIPTYNEFYERRWFASGRECPIGFTELAGQSNIPIGTGLLFATSGVKVGAEICEDLWVPIPPSCGLAMGGAEVVANLSASDDIVGKYGYLRTLIAQQSARCVCGYVYASAGFGESSTDLCFDGKTIICDNGRTLEAGQRFVRGNKYVAADIDVEALRRDRMHITTYADCAAHRACTYNIVNAPDAPSSRGGLLRYVDPMPFVPADKDNLAERCEEIIHIQMSGLCQRLSATHTRSLVVGISGGLDSTLALLIAVRAFDSLGLDRKGITGITMPGFGTTGRTRSNAHILMEELGVTIREIPIATAVKQHFADIGHDASVHDVTYENSQARERTQILMDVANQVGGMVLGTGDLSELALGWATYNGDHMSMYGVNAGVPKTLVKHLVEYFARESRSEREREALLDIVGTPISPELIPADADGNITQKTEDLVGPYELHDFFLYYMLRYGFGPGRIFMLAERAFEGRFERETIKKWITTFFRRFFNQQFKRSCLPDGPKVGSVTLSPRGDWRMPSDASSALWLRECENL